MTAERLLGAVGDIRDEYVKEADVSTNVKVFKWIKWAAIAACVVVALIGARQLFVLIFGDLGGFARFISACTGISINVESSGGAGGGASGTYPYGRDSVYGSYEELTTDFIDPVFEAFAKSEEAQKHDVSFGCTWTRELLGDRGNATEWGDEYLAEAYIVLDRPGLMIFDASSLIYRFVGEDLYGMAEMRDGEFSFADDTGTRTDYTIDGIEVQKFEEYTTYKTSFEAETGDAYPQGPYFTDESYTYVERVGINGEWYYVCSHDEAAADALATALAHIAAGM